MICPASETEGRRALIDEGPFLFYMYNLDEDRKQQPAAEYEKEKRGRPAALVSLCLQIGDVVKLLRQSRCDLQMILKKKKSGTWIRFRTVFCSRGDRIRTCGLTAPSRAL